MEINGDLDEFNSEISEMSMTVDDYLYNDIMLEKKKTLFKSHISG